MSTSKPSRKPTPPATRAETLKWQDLREMLGQILRTQAELQQTQTAILRQLRTLTPAIRQLQRQHPTPDRTRPATRPEDYIDQHLGRS